MLVPRDGVGGACCVAPGWVNRYTQGMHCVLRTVTGRVSTVFIAGLALAGMVPGAAEAKVKRPLPRLAAFPSCASLLSYAHAGALKTNGTAGVPLRAASDALVITRPAPVPAKSVAEGQPTVGAAVPATGTADVATPSFSTTNVQETGVDEPDVVKTDGRLVYLVTDRTLRIVDVTGAVPKLLGSLALEGDGHQLLLRGGRLLVSASGGYGGYGSVGVSRQATVVPPPGPGPAIAVQPAPGYGQTFLTEIDITDPAAPKVARAMTVDGDFVGARLNGGTARIVIGSAPDPIVASDGRTFRQAVAASTTARFIPRTVLKSAISGRTFKHSIARCDQVRHPRSFSGTGLLTVMTIDLDRGLYSVDRDAVMAGAQTVYGSAGSLYVASQRYSAALEDGRSVPAAATTEIHRFDASRDGVTTYKATGEVPGFVLNQYALSEYGGRLRVATTQEPLWFAGPVENGTAEQAQSSSAVTVLDEQAGRLVPVGRVGDLGKGERIYAVRFVGDAGYVVTFRQIDPLYVVDLSTPTAPRVRGELKITGYSAYLHPLGDDLLLGVGQEATPEGRRAGSQVSLFDVSDPTAPKRLSQKLLGQGSSTAEFDPHAFLYWAPSKLAVLPLDTYDAANGTSSTGAVGLHVTRANGITDAGRVTHPGTGGTEAPIDRTLVIDGKLYTLSYAGLAKSALDTLAPESFTAFPAPAR
ncbi:MAG: benzoate transporter [Solirubrobacterales bacterium]|nr:benzoate transporter [Solirubrobacterales bacterium]